MRVPTLSRASGVSAVAHGLVLAALLTGWHGRVAAIRNPGTDKGNRIALVYSPARSAMAAAEAARKVPPAPQRQRMDSLAVLKMPPPAASNLAVSSSFSPAQGVNALGAGNVTVALPVVAPWPRPDLSQLPRGTRGDVVVEVTIDEQGRIVVTQVSQSMGAAIDATVLAAIESWKFKPATKDGVAVSSEQGVAISLRARVRVRELQARSVEVSACLAWFEQQIPSGMTTQDKQ